MTLQNLSPASIKVISDVVERVLIQESTTTNQQNQQNQHVTTLSFSDVGCIDRTGTLAAIPPNVQSAYQWEAWNVPEYDLSTTSSKSTNPSAISTSTSTFTTNPSISSTLSPAIMASTTAKSCTPFSSQAPSDHISRRARGRYHLSTHPFSHTHSPGQPLSEALTTALGFAPDAPVHTYPWVIRAKRYGWPPGYVRELVIKKQMLSMFDDDVEDKDKDKDEDKDEDKDNAKTCTPAHSIISFPLYIWAPHHPETNKMFQHLERPQQQKEQEELGKQGKLEEKMTITAWACPVE